MLPGLLPALSQAHLRMTREFPESKGPVIYTINAGPVYGSFYSAILLGDLTTDPTLENYPNVVRILKEARVQEALTFEKPM